jgi:hypothetical protein
MYKFARGSVTKKAKPEIWSEGKQFTPLDPAHMARVSAIIARRSSAAGWKKGSARTADFS